MKLGLESTYHAVVLLFVLACSDSIDLVTLSMLYFSLNKQNRHATTRSSLTQCSRYFSC